MLTRRERRIVKRLIEFASFYAFKHMYTDKFFPIIHAREMLGGNNPDKSGGSRSRRARVRLRPLSGLRA